MQNIKTNNN